jgi:cytochrome c
MTYLFRVVSVVGSLIATSAAWAAGDAARGAAVFQQCATCHSTRNGEQLTGPSLAELWEKTVPDLSHLAFRRLSR